jgi:hypothetical protein
MSLLIEVTYICNLDASTSVHLFVQAFMIYPIPNRTTEECYLVYAGAIKYNMSRYPIRKLELRADRT